MFEINEYQREGYKIGIVPAFVLEDYPVVDDSAESIIIVGRLLQYGTGLTIKMLESLIAAGYRAYRINCADKKKVAAAGGIGYYMNGKKTKYPLQLEIQNIEIILTNWVPENYTVPVTEF